MESRAKEKRFYDSSTSEPVSFKQLQRVLSTSLSHSLESLDNRWPLISLRDTTFNCSALSVAPETVSVQYFSMRLYMDASCNQYPTLLKAFKGTQAHCQKLNETSSAKDSIHLRTFEKFEIWLTIAVSAKLEGGLCLQILGTEVSSRDASTTSYIQHRAACQISAMGEAYHFRDKSITSSQAMRLFLFLNVLVEYVLVEHYSTPKCPSKHQDIDDNPPAVDQTSLVLEMV